VFCPFTDSPSQPFAHDLLAGINHFVIDGDPVFVGMGDLALALALTQRWSNGPRAPKKACELRSLFLVAWPLSVFQ